MGDWISLFDQKLGCPIRSGRHQPQKGQSHVASRARSDAEPIRGSFFSVPSRLASSSDPFLRPLSPRFLASSTPPLPILPSPLFCPCQRIREFEKKDVLSHGPACPGTSSNPYSCPPRGRISLANRIQTLLRSASVAPSFGRSIPARSTLIDPSRTRSSVSIGAMHG